MQPDDQNPYRNPPVNPGEQSGPVVSLSPDAEQGPEVPQSEETETTPSAPKGDQLSNEPIRWQATEYIHREKDHVWFVLFILIALALAAVAIFIIKSPTFAILVPVMAAALFIYTRRPPHLLDYTLGRHGLYINDQLFPFSEFKSFALMQGFDQYSIMLIPTKRFKPAVTINFPEEVGEPIVDMLAARMPMREVEPDVVDRIIRKLHL